MAALASDAVAALRSAAAGDVSALAALASKVLGYGVVAGAAVLKLPQARPVSSSPRPLSRLVSVAQAWLTRLLCPRSSPSCAPAARAA